MYSNRQRKARMVSRCVRCGETIHLGQSIKAMGSSWAHDGICKTHSIREFEHNRRSYRLRLEHGHDMLVEELTGESFDPERLREEFVIENKQ